MMTRKICFSPSCQNGPSTMATIRMTLSNMDFNLSFMARPPVSAAFHESGVEYTHGWPTVNPFIQLYYVIINLGLRLYTG
jgi:hypothetical protein